MTPSARLAATLDVLTQIAETPRPADAVIAAYFKTHRYIGAKDRAAVAERTYALLRHQGRLDWWLARLQTPATPRTRLLAYHRLIEKMSPSEIEGLWDGKTYAPAPPAADERKLIALLKGHTLDHPDMPEATALECPPWAEEALRRRFGDSFARELRAMMDQAPLDLRVNTLKIDRDRALAALAAQGIAAKPCALSPLGLRLSTRVALGTIKMLKEGALAIQDEGSQLVAMLVDAKPGQRVIDFCAGAGGKTLAIGAQMENKGHVIACDVLANRLKRSAERFRAAGLHNIETHPLTSEHDPWIKRHKGMFDRVLVDAPCSGTGTWRRNPDQKGRPLGPGVESLVLLQASILASAARLVKAGGRLIYATCSLLDDENEKQVEAFLRDTPAFELIPPASLFPDAPFARADQPWLRLTPAQNDTDGFFAAILQRKTEEPHV
jgi:16S rRNA (cytosine967-C5)-methyltransferase